MCATHMLMAFKGYRWPLSAPCPCLYTCIMATTEQAQNTQPGSAADEVRRVVSEQGIQFLFAQFVDMHGKPSAKLVPAHHIDDLLNDGAGFAGFAAGHIGQ